MEGLDTGSAGHKLAAQYVAGEFERSGLKPAGASGYIQPVKFNISRIDEAASSLHLIRGGKVQPLKLGEDAAFALRSGNAPAFEGAAVFAGYGFAVPEEKYDELRGLDVKGKIVVYLSGGPKSIPGELMSHYQSGEERWNHLRCTNVRSTIRTHSFQRHTRHTFVGSGLSFGLHCQFLVLVSQKAAVRFGSIRQRMLDSIARWISFVGVGFQCVLLRLGPSKFRLFPIEPGQLAMIFRRLCVRFEPLYLFLGDRFGCLGSSGGETTNHRQSHPEK